MLVRLCSKSFKLVFKVCESRPSRGTSWIQKRQRKQTSNCQHPLDQRKSKGIPKNIYFCFIDYAKAFNCVDHNKLWKILKEMGIPDHLTCLLRNMYRTRSNTQNQTCNNELVQNCKKEYANAAYCHPAYLTYMQSTSCKMQGC